MVACLAMNAVRKVCFDFYLNKNCIEELELEP
jgi:hypothetical protein